MFSSLYIAATENRSGKSVVLLGVMEMLLRNLDKVGFFRPIINDTHDSKIRDADIDLFLSYFQIDIPYEETYAYTTTQVIEMVAEGKQKRVIEGIIEKYNRLKSQFDFILCEGTDYSGSILSYEFDINAEICNNLKTPVLLVINAHQKSPAETIRSAESAIESFAEKKCHIAATIINRLDLNYKSEVLNALESFKLAKGQQLYTIPEEPYLTKPTVSEVVHFTGAKVLYGHDLLGRHVLSFSVAAMQLHNFLERISPGSLVIVPGDRADIIVACLAVMASSNSYNICGILLTGNLKPEGSILQLIEGLPQKIPILSIDLNTFGTASLVNELHSRIAPNDERKVSRALLLVEKHVDVEKLKKSLIKTQPTMTTPKMFEYELLQKAKKHKQHIVLPEGEEDRILKAVEVLLDREIVDISVLGSESVVKEKIKRLGLHINNLKVIDPQNSEFFDDFVETYFEMRKHKGVTIGNARDVMYDVSAFGTMMVYKGMVDAMVSGAIHSTASTIRPAFEIIKTSPNTSTVSSVFFMCLDDRVLVYGDCAICMNPNAEQLAEIALNSSLTARAFGIDPIVAMLSYSSGSSGKGSDVEKVRKATLIAKERASKLNLDLKIDGPIQYDAAVDPTIARAKMPNSEVAGKATIFIFPDLNTGNNTYKAVQQTAGAVAIGPVLQGLNRPVNDLSRGATIPDIINTVAITAIQSQLNKGIA